MYTNPSLIIYGEKPSRLKQIIDSAKNIGKSIANHKGIALTVLLSLAAIGAYKGFQVPERYISFYDKLEQLNVPYSTRKMIAASCFAETNHRQFIKKGKKLICKRNKAGDLGVSQILRDGVNEVKRRNELFVSIPGYRNAYQQSTALTSNFRKTDIGSLRNRMKADPITNMKFGTALLLYYDADVRIWCKKFNVKYDPRITIAVNNYGHGRIEELLKKYGNKWDRHILGRVRTHIERFAGIYNSNISGI